MDRFASCAKSAVSIQEQTCHKQGCVQLKRCWQELFQGFNNEQNRLTNPEQLIGEISRLKRKLNITQKSKYLLSDELIIIKQQLQITKNKLKYLKETKNIQQQLSLSQISSLQEKTNRIVIKQREQHIQILVTTLKEKNRQLQSFKTKNIQLIDQINSRNNILSKIHESTNSQLNYYKREISQLQENLQLKNKELENKQKWFTKILEKEREEWSKAKKNMQIRLIQKESELQELLEKEKKLQQIINDLQQNIKTCQQLSNTQKKENAWLNKIIQEAKIEYIHNQLIKLDHRDKKTKQNQDKKIKTKITQLSKHLKSHAMMSTGLPSAKTHRISNNSSASYIAPFRLAPQDLNLSQLEPTFDRNQINQF